MSRFLPFARVYMTRYLETIACTIFSDIETSRCEVAETRSQDPGGTFKSISHPYKKSKFLQRQTLDEA